ncbi:MAG: phage/plasmid primase, P4 family [Candidatus Bathyarchaeia archaeon]
MNAEDVRGECRFCGAETAGGADVCHRCDGNTTRQQWLEHLKNSSNAEKQFYDTLKTCFKDAVSEDGKLDTQKLATTLFNELTAEQVKAGKLYMQAFDEEGNINLYALAEAILYESPIKTDKHTYIMYRFNGKIWVDDVESYIQKRLVEAEADRFKPYHLTTLTQIIQGLTFSEFEEPPPNLICFENGVLDINDMTLKPHSPEYFFRNMINAEYKPDAKPTEFLKWLEEILPDEKARKCVQELFGYCLYRNLLFHYLFILAGLGRNGRTTLLRTLMALLGIENCASVPLELLPERFQVTNLIGKYVNIVSEPRSRQILETNILKRITGGDLIQAELKGKQKPINFINYSKLIILANELPRVIDTSYGWWERVILIEFPICIPEDKRIPDIEQRWLSNPEERNGIVNWALEGLKRLMANHCFTKSEAMRNQIEQYKKWSNPVDYFLEKYCEYAPNYWITKKQLYEAYKKVCEDEGLQIASEEIFSKELRKKPRVSIGQKRVEGKKERVWLGIKLKEEQDGENGEEENSESGTGGTSGTGSLYSGKVSDKFLEENKIPVPHAPLVPTTAGKSNDSYGKSIGELISEFLGSYPHDREWTTVEFEEFMVKRGLGADEARRLLERMEKDGEVFQVYTDLWRWT